MSKPVGEWQFFESVLCYLSGCEIVSDWQLFLKMGYVRCLQCRHLHNSDSALLMETCEMAKLPMCQHFWWRHGDMWNAKTAIVPIKMRDMWQFYFSYCQSISLKIVNHFLSQREKHLFLQENFACPLATLERSLDLIIGLVMTIIPYMPILGSLSHFLGLEEALVVHWIGPGHLGEVQWPHYCLSHMANSPYMQNYRDLSFGGQNWEIG